METRRLLESIGCPHSSEGLSPISISESPTLYQLARKNKIGALYVKSLFDSNTLEQLTDEWEDRKEFHDDYQNTLAGIGSDFPSNTNYAIVKSTYPFWCDSKDIDVLLFDDELGYIQQELQNQGYKLLGTSPTSADLLHPETAIQIDVQDGFSLQRVIYFDKESLRSEKESVKIDSTRIPAISKPGNLSLVVIHSVTEQLFILKEFYTAAFHLEQFSKSDYYRFTEIVDENRLGPACSAFFSILSELYDEVFDKQPPYINRILDRYSSSEIEIQTLRSTDFSTPHRYSVRTGIRTIGGKLRHGPFVKSTFNQLPRLINPRISYHILTQLFNRRTRDHYMHNPADINNK